MHLYLRGTESCRGLRCISGPCHRGILSAPQPSDARAGSDQHHVQARVRRLSAPKQKTHGAVLEEMDGQPCAWVASLVVSLVPSNGEPGLPSSCAAADSVVFRVASLRDRGGTQEAFFGDASSRTSSPKGPLKACRRRLQWEGREGVVVIGVCGGLP